MKPYVLTVMEIILRYVVKWKMLGPELSVLVYPHLYKNKRHIHREIHISLIRKSSENYRRNLLLWLFLRMESGSVRQSVYDLIWF